mgnify:CR=1 FL=1
MAISVPELFILVGAVVVSGLVRGFSGFGTAMVFLPVAGRVVDPFSAILILVVMDLFGPIPLLPRALRDGEMREVGWLFGAMAVSLPFGLWLLSIVEPEVFRWAVSLTIFGLLACLIGGLRHSLPFTPPTLLGAGVVSGVLGGLAGLAGPPIVLLYLASQRATEVIRANTLVFLVGVDIALLVVLAAFGRFELSMALIGLILFPPYALAGLVGQRLFDPSRARLYRNVAYSVVGVAALQGLPVWDGML